MEETLKAPKLPKLVFVEQKRDSPKEKPYLLAWDAPDEAPNESEPVVFVGEYELKRVLKVTRAVTIEVESRD